MSDIEIIKKENKMSKPKKSNGKVQAAMTQIFTHIKRWDEQKVHDSINYNNLRQCDLQTLLLIRHNYLTLPSVSAAQTIIDDPFEDIELIGMSAALLSEENLKKIGESIMKHIMVNIKLIDRMIEIRKCQSGKEAVDASS